MVEAFVGLVGGGKSYNSVRRMMSYMALGGRVCSNIRLTGYLDSIKDLSDDSPVRDFLRSIGWEYQPRQYVFIPFEEMVSDNSWFTKVPAGIDREHRTLLVIDEATDLFDTLDGGKLRLDSQYREIFHFLRLSRHVHVDVLFIAQDINSINSRLKGLVANIWRSTDMKKFRLAKLKVPFPFNLFMLQQFDRTGKYETRREWVKKDVRVFGLYESEAFNNSMAVKWDGVAVGDGSIKKGVKKMSKFEKILLLLSLCLSAWAVFFGGGGSPSAPAPSAPVPSVAPPAPSAPVPSVAPPAPSVPVKDEPKIVRGVFRFFPASKGSRAYVLFDDKKLYEDSICEQGTVRIITRDMVSGVGFDGVTKFYLLPIYEPPTIESGKVIITKCE